MNKRYIRLLLNLDLNINSAQIAKLKLGHDFSNNGIDLSGGQEQKIGIAQALYFDKNIIILDEPTASLDVSAENIIYELVKNFVINEHVFLFHTD